MLVASTRTKGESLKKLVRLLVSDVVNVQKNVRLKQSQWKTTWHILTLQNVDCVVNV